MRIIPVLLAGLTLSAPTRAPAACESPATEIQLGQQVRGSIRATDQPYPANALYYCVTVPEGRRELTMTLAGMTVDLDLYVALGTIRLLQGADISQGENYQWKSNEFGTVTETVTISRPRAGVYYVEVVSYEGLGSSYTFRATAN